MGNRTGGVHPPALGATHVPLNGRLTRWLELRQVTIRKDDLDTDQVISGEPVFPAKDPQPPAQRQPSHSHQRTSACGKGEAVLLERRRHPAQLYARAEGGHTAPRQIAQPSATRRSRTHGSPSVRRSNGLHCVAHSNPCRPTKRPDRPSVLDQHHGGCRSEVAAPRLLRILPAVPLYSPVDRSLQGQVSPENGGRAGGTAPRHHRTETLPRPRPAH
jgi:hypothetical protein